MCRMRQFLAVLRSFFHFSLLRTFSCHPSPPTILPSSLTSSCHLFLGLPLNLVFPKFIYFLGILLYSCISHFVNIYFTFTCLYSSYLAFKCKGKGKAGPLQTLWCPEGSRKLRFPDFVTTAQDVGNLVSLTHRPPLQPGNTPGTHLC